MVWLEACAPIYIYLYRCKSAAEEETITVLWTHSNINTHFTIITFGKIIFILVAHYATFKFYINYITRTLITKSLKITLLCETCCAFFYILEFSFEFRISDQVLCFIGHSNLKRQQIMKKIEH